MDTAVTDTLLQVHNNCTTNNSNSVNVGIEIALLLLGRRGQAQPDWSCAETY